MLSKKDLQIAIGKRIREIREKKNIPQQVIAAKCNIEKSNFSRIEAGKTNPTLFTLYKIAYNLNISISELIEF